MNLLDVLESHDGFPSVPIVVLGSYHGYDGNSFGFSLVPLLVFIVLDKLISVSLLHFVANSELLSGS